MSDLIFAIAHLFLLLGAIGYAFYSLIQGNFPRFLLLMGCLILYYFLVLHTPVKKELERKRQIKKQGDKP